VQKCEKSAPKIEAPFLDMRSFLEYAWKWPYRASKPLLAIFAPYGCGRAQKGGRKKARDFSKEL